MGYYTCTRTSRSDLNKLDHQSPTTVLVGGVYPWEIVCTEYLSSVETASVDRNAHLIGTISVEVDFYTKPK